MRSTFLPAPALSAPVSRALAIVILAALWLACFTGCGHNLENKEAVKQAVNDRLVAVGMPGMNIEVTSVQFHGKQADATVLITANGMSAQQGMSMPYKLEQQNGKWVVLPPGNAGQAAHGGVLSPGIAPGMDNPHGKLPPAGPDGKMPSPADLPPAGAGK